MASASGRSRTTSPSPPIGDVSQAEGNSGSSSFVFTASLTGLSSQTVTVDWSTADGTAVAPGEYAAGSGTLSFSPGQVAQTAAGQVSGDVTYEPDEAFLVNLANASGASIADGQAVGGILNDDPLPSLSVSDVSEAAGTSGASDT